MCFSDSVAVLESQLWRKFGLSQFRQFPPDLAQMSSLAISRNHNPRFSTPILAPPHPCLDCFQFLLNFASTSSDFQTSISFHGQSSRLLFAAIGHWQPNWFFLDCSGSAFLVQLVVNWENFHNCFGFVRTQAAQQQTIIKTITIIISLSLSCHLHPLIATSQIMPVVANKFKFTAFLHISNIACLSSNNCGLRLVCVF